MIRFFPGILLIFSWVAYPQQQAEKAAVDSIAKEADILYSYAQASRTSKKLLKSEPSLRQNINMQAVYGEGEKVIAIFTDSTTTQKVAQYTFNAASPLAPISKELSLQPLTENEKTYLQVQRSILKQLESLELHIPSGYTAFNVMVKTFSGYRFYLMMHTTDPEITPLGNDFLFYTDREGKILSSEEFHSHLVPISQEKVRDDDTAPKTAFHRHLPSTPYISATGICVFRLYRERHGLQRMRVLSPENNCYYYYDLESNTVTREGF